MMTETRRHSIRSKYWRNSFLPALIIDLSRNRKGGTAVEFAIVAPLFLLILFGGIETGRMLWTLNALHYSVQEAARCASINATTCATAGQIAAFAAARSGATLVSSVFTASIAGCGNQVSASYPMQLSIPFVDYSITLTAQSCYPL
jgi:Flp pilus assembly protein TadG